jgi:hypothetical protein
MRRQPLHRRPVCRTPPHPSTDSARAVPRTLQPYRIEALEALLHQLQPRISHAIPDAQPLRLRFATGLRSD